jgi:hypothetical protein
MEGMIIAEVLMSSSPAHSIAILCSKGPGDLTDTRCYCGFPEPTPSLRPPRSPCAIILDLSRRRPQSSLDMHRRHPRPRAGDDLGQAVLTRRQLS